MAKIVTTWAVIGTVIGLGLTPWQSGNESAVVVGAIVGALVGFALSLRLEARRQRYGGR